MIGIKKEFLMKDLILFQSISFSCFNYILEAMMLKREKFVIQWRKVGLKRSCIS